ncbi:MAG: glycosyltransferase family 39 protein [Deltaproteobacteria bacterium]|nr:glycosyltransferase family 39 protein [Deltaproteobacteria bacterium]
MAEPQEPVEDTPRGRAARGPGASIATIVIGAVLVAIAIGVRGDFPLSDDWSYAYAVRSLCEDGTLRLLPWTGASLVLQAWYGAALCRLFGFSFVVLRVATVVLATTGVIGFHLLLRRLGVRGSLLAIATLLLALDPLYVNLAFTFMTDVPFTVAAVWAGYWYFRGLAERRDGLVLAGALSAAAALLIRQHGIFVAAAATLAILLARDRPWRARAQSACAAALLPGLVFVAFHVWLLGIHGVPPGYANKLSEAHHVTIAGVVNCAFRAVEYLGLLLAPLALFVGASLRRRGAVLALGCAAAVATAAAALYLREHALMFYLTNVLYDLGLGAASLRDTLFLGLPPPTHVGTPLGVTLTLVATVSAGVLAAGWTIGAARLREPAPAFLTLSFVLLLTGSLLHTRYYFDRYILVVAPFAIAALLVEPADARAGSLGVRAGSLLLTLLLGWYAVAGTHDYLAWNRARDRGLTALQRDGVAATEIDGGVEFNAWQLAATLDRWPTDADVRIGTESRKSWWWVVDDRFVLSFRPLPGYTVARDLTFARWLVPGRGHVYVLARATDAAGGATAAPSGNHGRQNATRSSASGRLSSTMVKSAGTIVRVTAAVTATRRRTTPESCAKANRTSDDGSRWRIPSGSRRSSRRT